MLQMLNGYRAAAEELKSCHSFLEVADFLAQEPLSDLNILSRNSDHSILDDKILYLESCEYVGVSLLEAPYLLRQFRPDDLSSVVEINRLCLPENYSPYFFMEVFKSCPDAFIVAEREIHVVGYIMCRLEFGFSDVRRFRMVRKGHIVSVAVLPEYRRRGIGREMVTAAMRGLELHGTEECFLEVRTANDEAVKLYRDMGFDPVRTVAHYYHDGADAFLMSVRLPYVPPHSGRI